MNKFFSLCLVRFWNSPLWIRKTAVAMGLRHAIHPPRLSSKHQILLREYCNANNIDIKTLNLKDIKKCFSLYGITPIEYLLYNFQNRNDKERDTFLSDTHRIQLLKKYIGLELFRQELLDKYKFFLINKPFFKREAIKINSKTNLKTFADFVNKHKSVFIKENASSYGSNAQKLNFSNQVDLSQFFRELTDKKDVEWIVEELILQDDSMSVWNQSTVNTVRIPSILIGSKNIILQPFLRTGRPGAVVDNAGAGGIFAVADPLTGTLITDGVDEYCNKYSEHPFSKIKYKGWKIPKWQELLEIVTRAHNQMHQHKYIAFDFALTPNGWVMVEGNWGQFVGQIADQKGIKKEFIRILKGK